MQSEILERLESIRSQARELLVDVIGEQQLEEMRVRFMGKKGELTQLLRSMGQLSEDERPLVGQKVNTIKQEIEKLIEQRGSELKSGLMQMRFESERIDVTQPGRAQKLGNIHPLTKTYREIISVFSSMGFEVCEGPEIELEKYNFEMLNIPANHPAREMQDTFYVDEATVLRTHTSPVQVRTMLTSKPPIRMLSPGRVFRVDDVDATHSPVFHQLEGLAVDKGITMADLKSVLDLFAKKLFGSDTKTRLRPSFFPFTEPSAEVDVSCVFCHGKGCGVCKGTGWIEVLGSGMVHPNVLEGCGIDSDEYSGFAFGMGIDRITNLKYGITDIRLLYENDVRFLEQF